MIKNNINKKNNKQQKNIVKISPHECSAIYFNLINNKCLNNICSNRITLLTKVTFSF